MLGLKMKTKVTFGLIKQIKKISVGTRAFSGGSWSCAFWGMVFSRMHKHDCPSRQAELNISLQSEETKKGQTAWGNTISVFTEIWEVLLCGEYYPPEKQHECNKMWHVYCYTMFIIAQEEHLLYICVIKGSVLT